MKEKTSVVLLATYNGGKYIRDFLDSLVAQTYTDFKLLVRDDGSKDDTLEILRSYSHKIDIAFIDENIRLGPAKSFLALLEQVGDDFDFYFFADQDDFWNESKMERAVDQLSLKGDEVAMYCSRLEYVDECLVHISYSNIPRVFRLENALVENVATGCTVALNRSARHLILEHPPSSVIMHDWWFYIACAALGTVIYDPTPTIKYRQHGNNAIGAATNIFQDVKRRLNRFIANDGGIFGLAAQTLEFKRCFFGLLSKNQQMLVDDIINGKKTFSKRLQLVFASKFIRQRRLDTLILRLLFLVGRF